MTLTRKKIGNTLALMAALATLAFSGQTPTARCEESAPDLSAGIPKSELRALAALFQETGSGANPCRTQGVTCRDGHVVKLTPHDQNLRGHIPPGLETWPDLRIWICRATG
jgi:hypothetical protein